MSSSARYRHLFTPLRIGPITVPNRIVFSAHLTNYAEDGLPTEQHAAYYEARAAGGAGLIITEEHSTHPTDWPYEKLIHGFNPDVVAGYRRITDGSTPTTCPSWPRSTTTAARRPACTPACRCGRRARSPTPCSGRSPRRSSPTRSPRSSTGTPWWPGTAWTADSTASSCSAPTRRSCAASSPRPPTRAMTTTADRWPSGPGSCSRSSPRCAQTIGPDQALGVRLCGDELIEGGTDIDDAVAVARMVEATGQVDYINTSIGVATATLFMIEASMQVPPGYAMFIPSAIRQAVELPVVGVGRFKDPAAGRSGPRRRAVRSGRRGAGPDRRRRLRGQGPVGARHRHPHLPVVQPGVRRTDGPQPVARLHREPEDRAARSIPFPSVPAPGGWWWSAAARAGCRPR